MRMSQSGLRPHDVQKSRCGFQAAAGVQLADYAPVNLLPGGLVGCSDSERRDTLDLCPRVETMRS